MAKGCVRKNGKKWYYRFYVEEIRKAFPCFSHEGKIKERDTYFEVWHTAKPGK